MHFRTALNGELIKKIVRSYPPGYREALRKPHYLRYCMTDRLDYLSANINATRLHVRGESGR